MSLQKHTHFDRVQSWVDEIDMYNTNVSTS